ncbi:PadR family transcriptional regulator [Streptomyces sp. NPDC095614]|uniref:PadR family transcriptional regulator n=1 Tax=Streptomyces sp. NPDC095614 TaxID=3156692 RepID=UPI003326068F
MALPNLETTADYLGTRRGALVHQFQRLERDLGNTLFHRAAFKKSQRPTRQGNALLRSLAADHIQALMHSALGPNQITPMPDTATLARAEIRLTTRKSPGSLRPFGDDITAERIRITGATLILLRDLLAHQNEEFYGAQIHARTGIDNGTLYSQLKRMVRAGWLTSWPEAEDSWLARAPVGCGPGRRRIYYALTPDGLRAAAHEVRHHKPRRRTTE